MSEARLGSALAIAPREGLGDQASSTPPSQRKNLQWQRNNLHRDATNCSPKSFSIVTGRCPIPAAARQLNA